MGGSFRHLPPSPSREVAMSKRRKSGLNTLNRSRAVITSPNSQLRTDRYVYRPMTRQRVISFSQYPQTDRRTYWSPRQRRPFFTITLNKAGTSHVFRPSPSSLAISQIFKTPKSTIVCVRRHSRREVLFAKRSIGRGMRHGRRRISRNSASSIRC